jgi:hypothetical protein
MLVFDGLIAHGVVTAIAAILVAIVGLRLRPGESGFLGSAIYRIGLVATIPALWMVVQILPLQNLGVANPIWKSTAAAIGRSIDGSISIDPGATLISLSGYLSTMAIAFVAAAVAIDRHRAERTLFALTLSLTLVALTFLATRFGIASFANTVHADSLQNVAIDCAGIGAIITASTILHLVDSAHTRGNEKNPPAAWYQLVFLGSVFALVVCLFSVITSATGQTDFAVAAGVATLAIAAGARHFQVGPWGNSAIAAVVAVLIIAVVSFQPAVKSLGMTLAFAKHAPPPMLAVSQRVLAETPWTGTGAGTFASIMPIYRDLDEASAGSTAPNAVAQVSVEMGRPFLLSALLAAIAFALMLLRGAIRRGRDWIYSATGAACVVTAVILAFGDGAILAAPLNLILAATVGMAVAQTKSRPV